MKLSIIMPAYNEERRIGRTLDAYSAYFETLRKTRKLDYEILIVINNTTDRTLEVVKKYQKSNKRILSLNLAEGGKGYAITEGFKDALKRDSDLIGFVDADLATPPEAYYALVKGLGNHDSAIASRWIPGSIIKTKQTLLRKLMSMGFNFWVRSLFLMPYRDTQCGAKLFRRKAVHAVVNELGITRWAFDVDLIHKIRKKRFRIKEVPTIWEDKKDSKLDIVKVPFEMFSGIVRLRLINSPFSFIVRAYDSLPGKNKFHKLK